MLYAACKHTRGGFAAVAFAHKLGAQQGKGRRWDMWRDPCGVHQVPVSKGSCSMTQGEGPRSCLLQLPPSLTWEKALFPQQPGPALPPQSPWRVWVEKDSGV